MAISGIKCKFVTIWLVDDDDDDNCVSNDQRSRATNYCLSLIN